MSYLPSVIDAEPCLSPFAALKRLLPILDRPLHELSPDQLQALAEFKHVAGRYVEAFDRKSQSVYERHGGLYPLLSIFNRLFFDGALTAVQREARHTLLSHEQANGSTTHWPDDGPTLIQIDRHLEPREGHSGLSSVALSVALSVLLHECVHASFEERACGVHKDCRGLYEGAMGRGGHGSPWHRLAEAVERRAHEWLGIHPIDLRRADAVGWYCDDNNEILSNGVLKHCFRHEMED